MSIKTKKKKKEKNRGKMPKAPFTAKSSTVSAGKLQLHSSNHHQSTDTTM